MTDFQPNQSEQADYTRTAPPPSYQSLYPEETTEKGSFPSVGVDYVEFPIRDYPQGPDFQPRDFIIVTGLNENLDNRGFRTFYATDGRVVYHLDPDNSPHHMHLVCGCGSTKKTTKKMLDHCEKCPAAFPALLRRPDLPLAESTSRSDDRAIMREHYINGRWATLARIASETGKEIRVHHKTTNLIRKNYNWNNRLFTIVLSRNDSFTRTLINRFKRAEQVVLAQFFNIKIEHEWMPPGVSAALEQCLSNTGGWGTTDAIAIVSSLIAVARAKERIDLIVALGTLCNYIPISIAHIMSYIASNDMPVSQSAPTFHTVGAGLLIAFLISGVSGILKLVPSLGILSKMIPSMRTTTASIAMVTTLWDTLVPKIWQMVTGTPFPSEDLISASQEFQVLYCEVQEFERSGRIEKVRTVRSVSNQVLNMEQSLHNIQMRYSKATMNKKASPLVDCVSRKIADWVRVVTESGFGRGGTRMQPLAVRFIGATNVGKSTLTPFFIADVLKGNIELMEGEDLESLIYRRVAGSAFWSGYSGHTAVVWDDLGATADTATSPCADFAEIIAAVNTTPWNVPMADLADKARTYFRGTIICASSNKRDYAIKSLTHPEAFYRRFNLEVIVHRLHPPDPERVERDGIDTDCYAFECHALKRVGRGFEVERERSWLTWEQLVELARERYKLMAENSLNISNKLNERFKRPQAQSVPDKGRLFGEVDFVDLTVVMNLVGTDGLSWDAEKRTHHLSVWGEFSPETIEALADYGIQYEVLDEPPCIVETAYGDLLDRIAEGAYSLKDGILGLASSLLEKIRAGADWAEEFAFRSFPHKVFSLIGIGLLSGGIIACVVKALGFLVPGCNTIDHVMGVGQSPTSDEDDVFVQVQQARNKKFSKKRVKNPHHDTFPGEAIAQEGPDKNAIQLGEALTKSMVTIRRENAGRIGFGTVFAGRIMITPTHVWERACCGGTVTLSCGSWSEQLDADILESVSVEDGDLCSVELPPSFKPKRDYTGSIAPLLSLNMEHFRGSVLLNEKTYFASMRLSRREFEYRLGPQRGARTVTLNSVIWYEAPTVNGDCGGVVMHSIRTKPAKICGIHVAGHDGRGYAHILTRELYDALTDPLPSAQSCEVLPGFEVIERVQPLYEANKTALRKSPFYGLFTPTTRPSLCGDFVHEGVEHSPLLKAIQRYRPREDTPGLERAKEIAFGILLVGRLQSRPRVLDLEEAAKGVDSMEPISRSTSAGYPWVRHVGNQRGKTRWLGQGETWEISDKLRNCVEGLKTRALNGEELDAIFIDSTKDEKRVFEKSDRSNPELVSTRLVSVSPMDFTLLCRMYLGMFVDFLNHNRIDNTTTAGINPLSAEWAILETKLTAVGDNVYDGDWKKFDSSLSRQLIGAFFEVAEKWYQERDPNYSEDDCRVRGAIAKSIQSSKHLARGLIYRWIGCLPSGCFGTNQIDSVANLVVFIQAALEAGLAANDILNEMRFAFHGDDSLMAVSDRVSKIFTPEHVRSTGLKLGMTYTPASKKDSLFNWKRMRECQFLKREFLHRDGLIVAPLALESIKETIMWYKKNSDVHGNMLQSLRFALYELALHNTEEARGIEQKIVRAAIERGYVVARPTFSEATMGSYSEGRPGLKWGFLGEEAAEPESQAAKPTPPSTKALTLGEMSVNNQLEEETQTQHTTPLAQSYSFQKYGGATIYEPENTHKQLRDHIDSKSRNLAEVPDLPNTSADMRVQTVNFIDQVPPASGADPYQMGSRNPLERFATEGREHSIPDILMRPVPLSDVEWSQSDTVGTVLLEKTFPNDFLTDSVSRASKLQNFEYFRCSVQFRVAPNAMPFHAGRIVLFWEPLEALRGARAGRMDPQYVTSMKHVEINPNSHQPGLLEVPFVLPATYWNMVVPQRALGTFKVVVLNQLQSGVNTQSASLTPTYTLKDIELSVPTGCALAQGGAEPDGDDVELQTAQEDGVISRYTHGVSTISKGLQMFGIPLISQIAKPVQWIADLSTSALRLFGLSKPSSYTGPKCMIQTPGLGQPHMDGVSQAIRLSAAADNELPMLDGLFGTGVDEMDIGYVISRPCLAFTRKWNASDVADLIIADIPVHPGLCGGGSPSTGESYTYRPTPLAFVASCFKYWSGTIRYRVEIVSTGFHAGRLLITYDPTRGGTVANTNELGNNWSLVVDISDTNEVDFEVPYVSNVPCLPVMLDNENLDYVISRAGESDTDSGREALGHLFNGYISFTILSRLVHADTVGDNVDINVWVSGGSDMEFAHPNNTSYVAAFENYGAPAGGPIAVGQPVAQSAFYEGTPAEPTAGTEGKDRVSMSQIIPSPMNPPLAMGEIMAGEKISSLRQLTKRLTPCAYATLINTAPSLYVDPDYLHAYDSAAQASDIVDTAGTVVNYQSFYDYVSAMYVGTRGGVRYQVETDGANLRVSQSVATAVNRAPMSTNRGLADYRAQDGANVIPVTSAAGFGSSYSRGPTARFGYSDLRAFEFEVPQTSRTPWRVNTNGATLSTDLPLYSERQLVIISPTTTGQTRVVLNKAASEDCSFGYLVAPPIVTRIAFSMSLGTSSQIVDL